MEYNPKYPQPFTLTQAIALDPAVAADEIARLNNSLVHLRRSQNELQECLRDLAAGELDPEISQAVKENEITIASQDERIFMLKLALTHHGYYVSSAEQTFTSSPSTSTGNTVFNSNGLDDHSPNSSETRETSQQNGVYL